MVPRLVADCWQDAADLCYPEVDELGVALAAHTSSLLLSTTQQAVLLES